MSNVPWVTIQNIFWPFFFFLVKGIPRHAAAFCMDKHSSRGFKVFFGGLSSPWELTSGRKFKAHCYDTQPLNPQRYPHSHLIWLYWLYISDYLVYPNVDNSVTTNSYKGLKRHKKVFIALQKTLWYTACSNHVKWRRIIHVPLNYRTAALTLGMQLQAPLWIQSRK